MKNAFEFDQVVTSLDWYEVKHHIINWNDYNHFELERRYGPSWWLFGFKFHKDTYYFEKIEIGKISYANLKEFIKWAKMEDGGSRILSIHCISSSFDIFKEIADLTNF